VKSYEIHRSTKAGFTGDDSTRIAVVSADSTVKGSAAYGHVPMDYRMGDYDHIMAQDDTVAPSTTYHYRVRAVDTAGQKGPFSSEASVHTKAPAPPGPKASASSVYAPEYGPDNAVDGNPDPYAAWISAPYGGGTRAEPRDAWLIVELPGKLSIRGVRIVGDARAEIPLQKAFRIDVREAGGAWRTTGEAKGAAEKSVRVEWPEAVETDAVRFFVPAADLRGRTARTWTESCACASWSSPSKTAGRARCRTCRRGEGQGSPQK
jgi:hypothetical protein